MRGQKKPGDMVDGKRSQPESEVGKRGGKQSGQKTGEEITKKGQEKREQIKKHQKQTNGKRQERKGEMI